MEVPKIARRLNRNPEGRRRRAVRNTLAAVAITGAAIWLDSSSGSQTAKGAEVTHAEVFKISPATIDCRARTSAKIESDAYEGLRLHVPKVGGSVPFFGKLFGGGEQVVNDLLSPINHTVRIDSQFRGPNGQGGGQVDVLTCVQATEMTTTPTLDGGQLITAPASAVDFDTKIVEDQSQTLSSNGVIANIGIAEWGSLPPFILGSLSRQVAVGVANTQVAAREAAANYAQDNCMADTWSQTQLAAQDGEREIGFAEYLQAKAHNPKLTFDPSKIIFKIIGTPNFTPTYSLVDGMHASNTLDGKCVVDGNAYQAPVYSSPSAQPSGVNG